jgi:hypothetical protein
MISRFSVLFQEARNTVKHRFPVPGEGEKLVKPEVLPVGLIENFLTEALALVVRADWEPMRTLLVEAGVLDRKQAITGLRPYTQQTLVYEPRRRDRARLDLVLVVDGPGEVVGEVWLEVKAGSPFTGKQIEHYLEAIDSAADKASVRRRLAVLGRAADRTASAHFDDQGPVPTLTWTSLARVAAAASPVWRDFALFLREQNLVEPEPRSRPAPLSLDCIGAAIAGVELPSAWRRSSEGRDVRWPPRGVGPELRRSAKRCGVPFVQRWAESQFTRLDLGVGPDLASLSIGLGVTAAFGIPYGVLWRRASDADLVGAGWRLCPHRDDDVILSISRPADEAVARSEGSAWFRAQLVTLEAAGLLIDLDGNGRLVEHSPIDRVSETGARP